MIKVSAKYARVAGIAVASAALMSAFALTAVGARMPAANEAREIAMLADHQTATALAETPASQMFPDAADGVDPVVTGPVSAQFRERQKAMGCETAVWPNIPIACYPD